MDTEVNIKVEQAEPSTPPQIELDTEFPFGRPEAIDWSEIDPIGHELIKELNLRPWVKTTEYHAGEPTEFNLYQLFNELDTKYVRGIIPDVQFRRGKSTLREEGITRFFLNVNVYSLAPFFQWVQSLSVMLISVLGNAFNPIIIRLNPMRPHLNFSIYWDYWIQDEKEMIHQLCLETLKQIPV